MAEYSVIVPVHNEENSIMPLCSRIKQVMDKISGNDYEIIFVDDGSTDNSLANLQKIIPEIDQLIILSLNKNYGQSSALQAGLDNSCGKIVITLDGDLQNDPQDIPKLLFKMREGYDVVCGRLDDKHPRSLKACASYLTNYLRRALFKEKIHDVGCMFRVYSRNSLAGIILDGCKHRFLTLLLAKNGAKISEVTLSSHPRLFGVSKYGICDRLVKSIPELFRIFLLPRKTAVCKTSYKIKEIIKHRESASKNPDLCLSSCLL